MPLQETATYAVATTLSTESGELPSDEVVAQLIHDQMSGDLDEETGLRCIGVLLTSKVDDA